jgi:Ca2+-binding RTX toxin-like protein
MDIAVDKSIDTTTLVLNTDNRPDSTGAGQFQQTLATTPDQKSANPVVSSAGTSTTTVLPELQQGADTVRFTSDSPAQGTTTGGVTGQTVADPASTGGITTQAIADPLPTKVALNANNPNYIDVIGKSTNLTATNGSNYIKLGNKDDTVIGGEGNDFIDVGGGNNKISSGTGDSVLYSGAGNDIIVDAGGNDVISSGAGDDDITNKSKAGQSIWIDAGAGSDVVRSGEGNEVIDAGGPSKVKGTRDTDLIYSGAGDDLVFNAGDNLLYEGGAGTDTFVARQGRNNYTITTEAAATFDALPAEGTDRTPGNGYNLRSNDGAENFYLRGVEQVYFLGDGDNAPPLQLLSNPSLTPPVNQTPV